MLCRKKWLLLVTSFLVGSACSAIADEPSAEAKPSEPRLAYHRPSLPTFAVGGAEQFWSDELVFQGYRIQRNAVAGHYRLLNPQNYRLAWGDFDQCRECLAEIRTDKTLTPPSGTAVITLHGLLRSRDCMEPLGASLSQSKDWTWVNVGYASTQRTVDEHAASLAKVFDHLEGFEQVHLVCHSLGNIVVRRYLGEAENPQPAWKVDPRLQRMVMLGPPNQGAQLARQQQGSKIAGLFAGPSMRQLGDGWLQTQPRLGTPSFEFGIIAGKADIVAGPNHAAGNPLLHGDDDLIVGLEETKLAGASDYLILPLNHGQLTKHSTSFEAVHRFLKEGYFTTQEKRQPIVAVEKSKASPVTKGQP